MKTSGGMNENGLHKVVQIIGALIRNICYSESYIIAFDVFSHEMKEKLRAE